MKLPTSRKHPSLRPAGWYAFSILPGLSPVPPPTGAAWRGMDTHSPAPARRRFSPTANSNSSLQDVDPLVLVVVPVVQAAAVAGELEDIDGAAGVLGGQLAVTGPGR